MKIPHVRLPAHLIAAILLCFVPVPSLARFAQPSLLPVEQLLSTVEARLKANPGDAVAHYTAGRIHYLAFYNLSNNVSAYSNREPLPSIAPYWTAEQNYLNQARSTEATSRALKTINVKAVSEVPQQQRQKFWQQVSQETADLTNQEWKPPVISDKEAIAHAEQAMQAFDKAIKLDASNGLFHLGRASLLEQFASFAKNKKVDAVPKALDGISAQKIRGAYFDAWTADIAEALKLETKPVPGLRSIVSYEAGKAFVRLCGEQKGIPAIETERSRKVEESIAKLDKLRRGAITPIVFSMRPNAPLDALDELLQPDSAVPFDLDGDGVVEKWPWVRSDTGFLVWDPGHKGTIVSGRQMFGSYTFQIPWNHGYEPLAMLDANGDAKLSKAELNGIRAWFDRNGNGVSDAGEVVDLSELDVEAIGLEIEQGDAGPFCKRGLRLNNGTSLATWDWLARPRSNP